MADVELVIKIPEEIYTHFMSRFKYQSIDDIGLNEFGKVGVAIKNGTPLPKGYEKIIDATFALEAKITKDNIGVSERTKGWNEACQAIYENAPAIIEADESASTKEKSEDRDDDWER